MLCKLHDNGSWQGAASSTTACCLTIHSSRRHFVARLNSGVRPHMSHPQHKRDLLLGFLAASLVAPVVLYIIAAISSDSPGPWYGAEYWLVFGVVYHLYGFPVAFAASLILGAPLVLWLRAKNRFTITAICAVSTVVGAITLVVVWFLLLRLFSHAAVQATVGAFVGLVSGIGFCIAVGPNNSFRPTPHRGAA